MLKKRNASAEGTQRFVSRMRQEFSTYNQTSYRYLNGTDLMVSKVGYGSYRVDQQNASISGPGPRNHLFDWRLYRHDRRSKR